MTDQKRNFDPIDHALATRLSRRSILRRAFALSLSAPAVASLLTACNEDDEAPATETAAGDTPTATSDDSDETPETDDGADIEETATVDGSTVGQRPIAGRESPFDEEEPGNLGGTIIEGAFADALTVNPILVTDTASERFVDMMFSRLVDVYPSGPNVGEAWPVLAESYEISDDGLEYTFTLRDGVQWHDGEPFTAADVEFTYTRHMDAATGSPRTAELTERIESIEVVDDHTIVFTLNFPVAPFLVENAKYHIAPMHILGDVAPEDMRQHPFSTGEQGVTIGTGKFMFQEWSRGEHFTATKNPNYFEGEPYLDEYIYKIVPDSTILAQQLRTGEVDFGEISESLLQEMQQQPNLRVDAFPSFSFTYYAYQLDPEKSTLFQEKSVRQALFYAIDREALIETIRFGMGDIARGTMPVPSFAYAPDEIEIEYTYDPNRASELLDEAGWIVGADGIREKDGQRLGFTIYTNSENQTREQYITVMQQQWREIGVECTPQLEDGNALIERIAGTKDFEVFLFGFSWGVDPDQSSMWSCDAYDGGFNVNRYCNPDVDELLEQGLATTDPDERREIYIDMQNIIWDDLPSPIMDFPMDLYGVSNRVHNLFPNAISVTHNAHNWWVDA